MKPYKQYTLNITQQYIKMCLKEFRGIKAIVDLCRTANDNGEVKLSYSYESRQFEVSALGAITHTKDMREAIERFKTSEYCLLNTNL